MKYVSPQAPIDILERISCVIDYMASSIATKEASALIEQAGAFFILSDASNKIKEAMDILIEQTKAINKTIEEATNLCLIDDRFEEILSRNLGVAII